MIVGTRGEQASRRVIKTMYIARKIDVYPVCVLEYYRGHLADVPCVCYLLPVPDEEGESGTVAVHACDGAVDTAVAPPDSPPVMRGLTFRFFLMVLSKKLRMQ